MRFVLVTLLSCLFLLLRAGAYHDHSLNYFSPPDTIPPVPPPLPNLLSGPDLACTGEWSVYNIDVPVSCNCQWFVDGIIQPGSSAPFFITWTQPGMHTISVVIVCSSGQTSDPETLNVTVLSGPDVFLGNDTTILEGQSVLLDAGNPGCDYLWSTGQTTRIIQVSVSGVYSVDVSNFCGSDADTIEVSVITGVMESSGADDCFRFKTQQKSLNISDLPPGTDKIRITDLAGKIIYDGPPVMNIDIDQPGIYLVRIDLKDSACHKKVYIP